MDVYDAVPGPEMCETCRFYFAPPLLIGQCHRRAPILHPMKDDCIARWPVAERTDYCGEYERVSVNADGYRLGRAPVSVVGQA